MIHPKLLISFAHVSHSTSSSLVECRDSIGILKPGRPQSLSKNSQFPRDSDIALWIRYSIKVEARTVTRSTSRLNRELYWG
ncbi:hypothetical protein DL98DRAFT_252268 [Cadophora sp. DSE1049]|nr:hypothetical protein DL98DRAFT_252268 [Cadophora sp. DSE1049]